MSEITIKYHPDYDSSREDAVFYAVFYTNSADCMACVSNGTQTFHVRVCGDTKARVWPTAEDMANHRDNSVVVRSGDEWKAVGITTDAELSAADHTRITWDYNSWYEVVADDSTEATVFEGEVYHTVYDAVEEIKTYFEQQGTAHVHKNGVVELDPADVRATVCGTCGRAWDDSVSTAVTPTPAGRCPFEYEHPEPIESLTDDLVAAFRLGYEEAGGDFGVTFDDSPDSLRSRAYDMGRSLGRPDDEA